MYNGLSGGSIPYNARYFDAQRSTATLPLITRAMTNISDITAAIFNGAVYLGASNSNTTLSLTSGTPLSFDGSQAWRSIMFRYPASNAPYLLPIDFFLLMDCSGTDASHYFIKGFVTNEKFFPTEAELRAAFLAGELTHDIQQTKDQSWALVNRKEGMGEKRFAPSSIELGGKRYAVDADAQYVEYMGWVSLLLLGCFHSN
jgi:primary-amine oxidase